MSTRRGEMVTLAELIEAIGVDAARFFLVMRSHDQTLDLDLDLARQQSQENPVYYVQYAHARIASILRNVPAETRGRRRATTRRCSPPRTSARSSSGWRASRPWCRTPPSGGRRTASPAYAQELAADFHVFYKHCRVIGVAAGRWPRRASRCAWSRKTGDLPLPGPARGERPREHVGGEAGACPSFPRSRPSAPAGRRPASGLTFVAVEQVEPFMLRDCSRGGAATRCCPARRVDDGRPAGQVPHHRASTAIVLPHAPPGHDRPVCCIDPADDRPAYADASARLRVRACRTPTARSTCLEFRDMRKFGRLHLTAGGPAPRLRGPGSRRLAGRLGRRLPGAPAARAARPLSRPSCSTSGTWPASATSTPTRSSGGRRSRRCGAAGSLGRGAGRLPGRRDPHQAGGGGAPAGLHAVGLRRHRGASRAASRTGCRPTAGRGRSAGAAEAPWCAWSSRGRGTAYCPDCQR